MANKFLNEKVGVKFFEHLKQHDLFKTDYKLISPSYFLFALVARRSTQNKDGWAGVHSRELESLFRRYECRYTDVLEALVELGVMEPRKRGFYDRSGKGKSRAARFKLTPQGEDLLYNSLKDYLRRLHGDPHIWRKVRKAASRRKQAATKEPSDSLVGTVRNLHFRMSYDRDAIQAMLDDPQLTEHQSRNLSMSITEFAEGKFGFSASDSNWRIHHNWIRLNSEARKHFSIGDNKYAFSVDIRACHPTFFGQYIAELYWNLILFLTWEGKNDDFSVKVREKFKKSLEYCNIKSNKWYDDNIYSYKDINNLKYVYNYFNIKSKHNSITNILHYLHDNVDTFCAEIKSWTDSWTNSTDPRSAIASTLGDKTLEQIKDLLNRSLNGGRNEVVDWIQNHHPVIHRLWSMTDLSRTGILITKFYETVLILDLKLYALAQDIGLEIIPEHDGFGVFCNPKDTTVSNKISTLIDHIKSNSIATFGVSLVFKVKKIDFQMISRVHSKCNMECGHF
jgi:hypothetical protein